MPADVRAAGGEGHAVGDDRPQHGDEAGHRKALHHRGEHVHLADHAAVEQRQPGDRHHQDERDRGQHPGGVAAVDLRRARPRRQRPERRPRRPAGAAGAGVCAKAAQRPQRQERGSENGALPIAVQGSHVVTLPNDRGVAMRPATTGRAAMSVQTPRIVPSRGSRAQGATASERRTGVSRPRSPSVEAGRSDCRSGVADAGCNAVPADNRRCLDFRPRRSAGRDGAARPLSRGPRPRRQSGGAHFVQKKARSDPGLSVSNGPSFRGASRLRTRNLRTRTCPGRGFGCGEIVAYGSCSWVPGLPLWGIAE